MLNTNGIANAVISRLSLKNDAALARVLGVKRGTVSNWRRIGAVMEDETAVKCADLLKLDRAEVLLWTHMERTKCPQAKAALERAARVLAA